MSKLNYFQTRPKLEQISVKEYLERIKVPLESTSLKYLKKLHKAHLHTIPFENLDIHYNKRIVLVVKSLFEKIIRRKRGGFCYELNTLFYHLLNQLGYQVYLISARVFNNGELSPEFDHMAIALVWEDENYLVDVGFGKSFVEPKKICSQPQLDYTSYYKFEQTPDEHWILKHSKDNSNYESVYQFELKPRELIEFIPRCNFHQESPESHFTRQKLITRLFPEGRVTLTDRKLKLSLSGDHAEHSILNEDEFFARLEEYFKIEPQALIRQLLD